ncbi:hypothetical protein Aduo_017575 [Ancylostoma duodenale]
MHLISTKFGFMLSGKKKGPQTNSPPNVMFTSEQELEQWDNYWNMNSPGIEEFHGPEREEKEQVNERVLRRFNDTIRRKKDGYYVLEEYDKVFRDQLQKGILEEIQEQEPSETIEHYLPHKPVFTPSKATTKIRIVFDASAHLAGKPSLNDVLYHRPLILPKLQGMMLRFRTGKIAIISDVEKAFLQVRLHKADRGATRCIWLKDVNKPPEGDNLVTYRFTRVTFGLNASPFLLSATIRFHLESEQDTKLAEEINTNLYVDNLFMSAETAEEGVQKYRSTKRIFNNLKMNLQEFMSNDESGNRDINPEDRAEGKAPKVLGIKWNTTNDALEINCEIPPVQTWTKRTVLSQLASIYDPMGWLAPLLIRMKLFFQKLWIKNYD